MEFPHTWNGKGFGRSNFWERLEVQFLFCCVAGGWMHECINRQYFKSPNRRRLPSVDRSDKLSFGSLQHEAVCKTRKGQWVGKISKLKDSGVKWSEVKVTQLCQTLCDPMDYRVRGILQARITEWVAFPFSRVSSQLRDWTQVSCIAGGFFTSWAIREVLKDSIGK